jgi:hypothetical protein
MSHIGGGSAFYVRPLRKVIVSKKRPTYIEEFVTFMTDVLAYDQRSAVIVIVAKLDALLYQVVKKMTFPSIRQDDELLDGDAPLSSLSAKITFIHRLGRMDTDLARALHLIRKIRNDFANKPDICGLDLSPHADRIRELVSYYKEFTPEYAGYRDRFGRVLKIQAAPVVHDFFTVCGIILQTIMEAVRRSEKWRSKSVPHLSLIPYAWKSERWFAKWRAEWAAQNPTSNV